MALKGSMLSLPQLGHGVGLRAEHFPRILDGTARADWFEVISENYMIRGGRPLKVLEKARELAPVVLHGVSMNLGGVDPLLEDYLSDLDCLIRRFEPAWISDHLCFSAVGGHFAHDLLPLPFTEEALAHVSNRIGRVQDRLGRRILIENVSSYLAYQHSTISEWAFLSAVAEKADCGILLDVNNIYVNSVNQGFDPLEYLSGLPKSRVGQFHLAGHSEAGTHLVDTHDQPVAPQVWDLYREAVRRFGAIPSLIERDDNLPAFEELLAESDQARAIAAEVLSDCTAAA
jgi:uncharacterized protein (UPF0276 family)